MSYLTALRREEATGRLTDSVGSTVIPIAAVKDIVTARQHGRELASKCGFSGTDSTLVATIISELARNILLYAQKGEINLECCTQDERRGLIIISRDEGPGIANVDRALMGGYSTSGGLGLGLSGVRRLVDEFHVDTGPEKGTTITAEKWVL